MPIAAILALLSRIPATALGLFTGLNWTTIFNVLTKYWYLVVIGLLGLGNMFTYHEWQATRAALAHEKIVHAQDIKDFKTAQAIADANAKAIKLALDKEAKADAAQADASYSTLLAKYHANLLRFSAGQSGAQPTSYHQLPSTQGGDRPGASTQLFVVPTKITISGADAEICAVNTARLQAVHDWAIALPQEQTK